MDIKNELSVNIFDDAASLTPLHHEACSRMIMVAQTAHKASQAESSKKLTDGRVEHHELSTPSASARKVRL